MLTCAVVEGWWDPEKPPEDREFPLNRLLFLLANALRGEVEFVRRHQAAILHDLLDGTFRLGIVTFEDAFFAAWRGKWHVKALNRVLGLQHQGDWFAVIAVPEMAKSQEVEKLAKEFAKDGGVLFGEMECFPPTAAQGAKEERSGASPKGRCTDNFEPDYGSGPPP